MTQQQRSIWPLVLILAAASVAVLALDPQTNPHRDAGAVRRANNGSDFLDAAAVRGHLSVPSIAQVNATTTTIFGDIATIAGALATTSSHVADASDPHTATLNQTNLIVASGTFTGFTAFGTGAPRIKMSVATGTLPDAVSSSTLIAHGVASSTMIRSISPLVETTPGTYISPGFGAADSALYYYSAIIDDKIAIYTGAGASTVQNKPVSILVIYAE